MTKNTQPASHAAATTVSTTASATASAIGSATAFALTPAGPALPGTRMTDAEQEHVLAAVISTSSGALHIAEQSARLRQAADLIPGFDYYRTLLIRSMKQAFKLGVAGGTRRAQAAKASWKRIFRHFARRLGLIQDIDIVALDRAGNYDCSMMDKATVDQEWRAFLKQGRKYFILRRELEVLAEKGALREAGRRVWK